MSLDAALRSGVAEMGIAMTQSQHETLISYIALLHKWNKVYNLTAIREPLEMISHHILDSLSVLPYLWPKNWLDVGCGAGLPGLVLAVMRPEWQFTLLDSNSKKTGFVQQAIIELGLKNVSVHCARVEEFMVEERFDGITSRAFTELGDFIEMTQHLVAEQGRWAAMKGIAEKELQTVPEGYLVDRVISLHVPKIKAARSLVVVSRNGAINP
ncbi:MAG: 16S rRNA (guanine(527)-N(7))-methyltransferase RsmG [Gallionella sp.]|nr:16S rRNA (guanine(527)-N(7))-methyltransferase RsmG [Gallionella sp.]